MNFPSISELSQIINLLSPFVLAAIVYVAKKYIDSRLQKQSQEFQIKFSSLHADRLTHIKSVYSKIASLKGGIHYLVVVGNTNENSLDELKKLSSLHHELTMELVTNKILLDENLATLIEQFLLKLRSVLVDFNKVIERTRENEKKFIDSGTRDYNIEIINQKMDEASEAVEKEIPKLLHALEVEFRKLIGS